MEGVKTRRAKISETDEVFNMHLSLQKHLENSSSSIWRYTEERKKLLKQQYTEWLTDKNSIVLVAEVGTKATGFLVATVSYRMDYSPNTVGNISAVYVQEKYRRRGIGSELVKEACRFFAAKKAKHIYVRYVLGDAGAERFWENLGFKPILLTAGSLVSTIEDRLSDT